MIKSFQVEINKNIFENVWLFFSFETEYSSFRFHYHLMTILVWKKYKSKCSQVSRNTHQCKYTSVDYFIPYAKMNSIYIFLSVLKVKIKAHFFATFVKLNGRFHSDSTTVQLTCDIAYRILNCRNEFKIFGSITNFRFLKVLYDFYDFIRTIYLNSKHSKPFIYTILFVQ